MSICSSKGKLKERILPSGDTVLFRVCHGVNCPKHGKRNRHKKAKQKLSLLVRLYKECHRDGEQLYHVTMRRSLNLSLDTFWRYVVAWLKEYRAYVVVSSSHGSIEHVHALVWSQETPLKPAWCNGKRQYHVSPVNEQKGIIKYVATNYAHASHEFRHMANSRLNLDALKPRGEDTSPPPPPPKTSSIETLYLFRHETPQKSTQKDTTFDSVLCSRCGIRPAASKHKYCVRCLEYDKTRKDKFNRRVNVNSRRYKIAESAIVRLYKAQKSRCYWCHEILPTNWQIEHVKARCHGGEDTIDNMVLSCPRCNEQKHTKTVKQWLSVLASHGIEHELMPDNMPMQQPLFEVTK